MQPDSFALTVSAWLGIVVGDGGASLANAETLLGRSGIRPRRRPMKILRARS